MDGAKPEKMDEAKARAVRGVRRHRCRWSAAIAVLAENTWAAIKGRDALWRWNGRKPPNDAFDSDAHAKTLEAAARDEGQSTRERKAPAGGHAAVARTIDATYPYPFYAHAPLETMNCIAHVEGDRCKIIVPTQAPNRVQKQVAQFLGTTPDKVRSR